MLETFSGKRVLLLQGPMGPFFRRLRKDLEQAGATVSKVNFCAGDALFYSTGAVNYRGTLGDWPDFLGTLLRQRAIDAVFLFGDCRPYHAAVRELIRWLNVELFVFEEGYLRPDYITIERGGVNNHSLMPREPAAYTLAEPQDVASPRHAANAFRRMAGYAMAYTTANWLFARRFPHYSHHRPLHPIGDAFAWVRGGLRKHWYALRERKHLKRLTTILSGRYFLVPLQVHNDAQVIDHSRFTSVEEFIDTVAASFAKHARPGEGLVFKHHPMDRAYRDYSRLMARLAKQHGLEGRLFYVHDLHLPALLKHARGTVVINSTVGLSSLFHGTPVKTLGDAIYNLPGLTCQHSLDQFWREPGSSDRTLYKRFHTWLLVHNQANGNFYRPLPGLSSHTGVVWPPLGAEVVRTSRALPQAPVAAGGIVASEAA